MIETMTVSVMYLLDNIVNSDTIDSHMTRILTETHLFSLRVFEAGLIRLLFLERDEFPST